jgi:hypothetical protein
MSKEHWRGELLRDVQRAVRSKRVIYLEGKTDRDAFAALIGVWPAPTDDLYDGVLVRGLRDKQGSGSNTLELMRRVAEEIGISGQISMVRDGDGEPFEQLSASFEGVGPLFYWPTYCIENLLAQVEGGWPASWGAEPDWADVMRGYAPYVALNKIHSTIQGHLKTLQIASFTNPTTAMPLLDAQQVFEKLRADRDLIAGYDVASTFQGFVDHFIEITQRETLDEAHAALNGKWLVNHYAANLSGQSPDNCRALWCEAVAAAGGHPGVKAWWERRFKRAGAGR